MPKKLADIDLFTPPQEAERIRTIRELLEACREELRRCRDKARRKDIETSIRGYEYQLQQAQ